MVSVGTIAVLGDKLHCQHHLHLITRATYRVMVLIFLWINAQACRTGSRHGLISVLSKDEGPLLLIPVYTLDDLGADK
jgi:hypothetical protein